jgi:hypothetical protein
MGDAYRVGGQTAALKILEQVFSKNANEKHLDSKLMKIFKNNWLMLTLMKDILPMGKLFRGRQELTVRWLSDAMKVVMGVSETNHPYSHN